MKEQKNTEKQIRSQRQNKALNARRKFVESAEKAQITTRRLSALIAHLPDGIILETSERTVLQVNQKFCDLFGIDAPPDALQGMDCREAAQQAKHLFKDSEGFVKRIDDILAAGKPVKNEELPLRDGRVFERDYVPMEVAPGQIEHLWHYRDITEQKKLEKELRQNQETSHAILEAMPDFIFVLDKNFIFQSYYAHNEKDLYIPPETFVGKNVDEVLPHSLAALTRKKANLVLKTGKTQIYEYSLEFETGLRFYEARMVPKGSEQTLTIIRDITKRKRREERIRAHLRQMEILQQTIADLNRAPSLKDIYSIAVDGIVKIMQADRSSILLFEEDGKVHFKAWKNLSPQYRRAVDGHSPWQRYEIDAQPLIYPDVSKADFGKKVNDALRKEGIGALLFMPLKGVEQLLGKFMVYWNAPHACSQQELNLAQVLAQNLAAVITRMQVLEESRRTEAKYRSIFENSAEGIYQSTPQGRLLTVNPALVKIFGFKKAEEMLALKDTSQLYWDESERKRLVRLANGKGTLTNVEVKMKRADGSPLWVLINERALKDGKGQTLYYEGTLLDITERKKNEIHNSVINSLLKRLSVSLSLKEAAKMIAEAAYKLFEYDAFSLDVVDAEQQMLIGIYNEDTPLGKEKPEETPVHSHPLKEAKNKDVLAGKAKLINRQKESSKSEFFTFGDQKLISKSLMFAPVLYEGKTVAIISVQSYTTNRYNEKDLEDLQSFAAQVSGSLLRIRAQEALRQSEKNLRSLIDHSPIPIVIYVDLKIRYVNQSALKILKAKNPKEVLSKSPFDFIHPDLKDLLKQRLKRLIKKGKLEPVEIKIIDLSGEEHEVFVQSAFITFEGQEALLAQYVDITESKKAEQALRQSERQYKELFRLFRAIADNMTDMLWAKDMNKRYIFANQAICKNLLNAKDTDEPIGKDDLFFAKREREAHPENPQWHTFGEICKDSDQVIIDTKEARQFDEFGNVKGKFIFLDVHKSPLLDENGKMIGIVGSARDVTREKEIQKQLQKSEAKFRAIAQTASDAIVSVDSSGAIMVWNHGAEKIFGYSEKEILGKPLTMIMPERFREAHIKGFTRVETGGEMHLNGKTVELTGLKKDGSEFPIEISFAEWDIGGERYFSAVIRDISERKLAEEQLLWSKHQQETINALLQIPLTGDSLKEKLKAALKIIVKSPLLALQKKGAIFLADQEGKNLTLQAEHNMPEALRKTCALVPYGQCLCGLAAETKEMQFADCVDERHTNRYEGMTPHGHYNVPILSGDKLLGVVVLYLPEHYQEKENDRIFLKAMANTLASVIEHSQAKEALEQQLKYAQALNTLSQQIILEQEPQKLLEAMARMAGETLRVERSMIYEIDLQRRKARALCEWLNPQAGDIPPTPGFWPLDTFKESEKHLTSSRRPLESHADRPHPLLIAEGTDKMLHEQMRIKSLLWYPFAFGDDAYYLLVFNHVRQFHRWSTQEKSFIEALTHHVEMGLLKIRLFEGQKQLAGQLLRLATVVDQSSESVVITDVRGNITYVNPAFEKLTGYAAEEALGKNPRILKSGKHDASFYRRLWDTILAGETWLNRIVNKRKDGRLYTEQAVIFPVKNPQGKIVNFCKIARDVSRELELEAQLRRSQKLETIGTLAGGIAHDFNNILAPILGYADLALTTQNETSPSYHYFQQILKAAQRAKDLVAQILLFAKQTEKEQKPLYLQSLVKEAVKLLRPSIPSTIKIEKQIDPNCGKVLADATQIHQVIVNLCTNAYQAMEDKGGTLTIELKPVEIDAATAESYPNLTEGEYVRLSVRDTGHGMDRATMEHIFDPFFTTKPVDKGTGLGLSVVHGIVRSHRGDIQVESEPGKGSVFHVYFPVFKKEMKEEEKTEESAIIGGQESILIVDDNKAVTDLIHQMLESLGYRVEVYNRSVKALNAFRRQPDKFDLLLSDLTMPEMTGLELAKEVHAVRADFPVVIMTGYGDNLSDDDRKKFGIRKVIGKPLSVAKLAAAIRTVLEK